MSLKSLPPVSENGDNGSRGNRASGKESGYIDEHGFIKENVYLTRMFIDVRIFTGPLIEGTPESGNDEKITSEDKSSKSVKSRISSSSLGN
ncbi:hypothetical protein PILCRDRAFT_376386 [Piloderma croceum F 1598]|uniref:Uncharacterized protein n=1 Tax=Piloderma croceum (strain F 1598) TaxID=765440 RepID=A0A0C3C5K0_PILCF|nr:hypothetical protein PILCRDRAFT_376386 [Piloderma croceum F 1598]